MSTIVLLVAVCIGMLVLLRSGLLQRDAQAHGTTVLQGAGQDGGPLQNGSPLHEGRASLGFGALKGIGPLQDGGPLLRTGPLQGNAPILAGRPVGVSDPIPGPDRLLVATPTTLAEAAWPPVMYTAIPIWSARPTQLPSDQTPASDSGPPQQPQVLCVTCFIEPPPPAPTPPPNNIVNCATVSCN